MSLFSPYNNLQVEYFVFGNGSKWIIAFHGFGRSASDFRIFEHHLGKEYKILSINLFHHGNSLFPNERITNDPLSKEGIKLLFEGLLSKLQIDDFSLIAYSIGGRMAFSLIELFPDRINFVKLFAPDGLEKNHWADFLNFTRFGQSLYRIFIRNGVFFISILNFLKAVKIINPKLHKFALMHIDTYEKRKFLYEVWMTYRSIFPDFNKIKTILLEKKIPFDLYIGRFDQIITLKKGRRFIQFINAPDVKLMVIDSGHNLMTEKTLRQIFN